MNCQTAINEMIEHLKKGFHCSKSENRLSIITPYLYPDNDLIEVFCEEIGPDTVRITDLGETLRHLESIGLDVYASSKRQFLLEQITKRLDVSSQRGKLEKEGKITEIGSLLMDVIAASQSVADLAYTSKAYEPANFSKEVSLFLSENKLEHEFESTVLGSSGKKYRVDIKLDGRRQHEVLIEAMSPKQQFGMTPVVNRVLRMWVDINGSEPKTKISLLNDLDFDWREEDLTLLKKWSIVQRWSGKEELLNMVKLN